MIVDMIIKQLKLEGRTLTLYFVTEEAKIPVYLMNTILCTIYSQAAKNQEKLTK